jgi:hypothetical protein
MPPMTSPAPLMLRLAGAADAPAVERVSRLDSSQPLTGTVLVAERDGHIVAAVSLLDGRVVADPFAPTADVVAVLRTRAQQMQPSEPRRTPFAGVLRPAL